ncbi:MAG: DUF2851 family protein [Runella sp.]
MTEDFLYFLWQFQHFDKTRLQTTTGLPLQIIALGQRNTDAGPDFLNTRIVIDGIEWAGSVEMHLQSSDWHRHHHDQNRSYDSVVLHVVWEEDEPIYQRDGTILPSLALKPLTDAQLLYRYRHLVEAPSAIPCSGQFGEVPFVQKRALLDRLLLQRVQRKAETVHELLTQNQQDWEETAYQMLAQNFGFKINAEPMLRLAQGLPLKILQKHRDNLFQIEALLFGQAGLIPTDTDEEYAKTLKREHQFLAHKYVLTPQQLQPQEWKFMRLRPANFPTVRLAQLAAFVQSQGSLFSSMVHSDTLKNLINSLKVRQSVYWQKHYHFKNQAVAKVPSLGKSSIENLLINSAVPLLVAYSEAKDNRTFLDKALEWLEQLPPEQNHITDIWETLGLKAENAADAQAMIELYNTFCLQKQCLQCNVGTWLLRNISVP